MNEEQAQELQAVVGALQALSDTMDEMFRVIQLIGQKDPVLARTLTVKYNLPHTFAAIPNAFANLSDVLGNYVTTLGATAK